MWEYWLIALLILVLAIIIDLLFGEPPWKMHPTFLLGELAKALEKHLTSPISARGKFNGVLIALIVIGIVVIPVYFGLRFIYATFGLFVYIFAAALILKLTLCINLETKWALIAANAVETGELAEGRKYVGYFSRRDETNLSGQQIVSAVIESMSENIPDFKLSSIFYYAFFGVPGAVATRVINTLDSVIGFKTPEHIHTGWFSAMLDTLTNYIPARFTVLLIVLASAILGEDWKNAWKIAHRDWDRIASINHGWPVAAMAGALRVQLEKPGHYTVGDKIEDLTPNHIMRAIRIRNVVILLCVILLLPLLFLTTTLFFPF